MKRLHIKAVCGYGLSSWAIAREGYSVGGWSHIAPMLPDGSHIDARDDWIHAPTKGWGDSRFQPSIAPGVQHRPPNYEKWKRWAVVQFLLPDDQVDRAHRFLWESIGDGYDSKAIAGFILGLSLHAPAHFICSALGYNFCRTAQLGYDGPIPNYEVSPDDLYLLMTNGWGGKIIASA